jgi:hypothetical protein
MKDCGKCGEGVCLYFGAKAISSHYTERRACSDAHRRNQTHLGISARQTLDKKKFWLYNILHLYNGRIDIDVLLNQRQREGMVSWVFR